VFFRAGEQSAELTAAISRSRAVCVCPTTQFEVVLFEGRHTARYVKHFAGMMLNRLSSMKGVAVLRADRVTLSDPQDRRIYVQIDWRVAGRLPAEIRIVPTP